MCFCPGESEIWKRCELIRFIFLQRSLWHITHFHKLYPCSWCFRFDLHLERVHCLRALQPCGWGDAGHPPGPNFPTQKGSLCLPEGPTLCLVVRLVPLGRAVACTWHRQVMVKLECLLRGSIEATLPNTLKVNPGFFIAYRVLFHENRGGRSHLHLCTRLPLSGL